MNAKAGFRFTGLLLIVVGCVGPPLLAAAPLVSPSLGSLGAVICSLPRTLAFPRFGRRRAPLADSPNPPVSPVKLVFIHHSTGENWLADDDGGLGLALRASNYFVSDTNYGWGPDSIGDRTDIGHWWDWFRGLHSGIYLSALYSESEQHSAYSRLSTDPGGENEIILFKSCFPNSHISGSPTDGPTSGYNPLRGEDAGSEYHTVANVKGLYNDMLSYFATRQDKLYVLVVSPPLIASDTDAGHAANARAVANWLVDDWLDSYPYHNVAVFDFYNVLTSNGGPSRTDDPDTCDLGWSDGNHHRWLTSASAVQHIQTVSSNYSGYGGGSGGGSHPTSAGNQKATGEFVPLLNVFYDRWVGDGGTPTPTGTSTPPTATPTATGTATATATGTSPAGQQTMVFQEGVSPDPSYSGTTDVILASDAHDNANLGGAENLETFLGDVEHRRSLMRWDLSALPDDATISGATLELYRYEGYAENAMELDLYQVTRDWTEGTGYDLWPDPGYVPDGATWLTATTGTAWTTPGGDHDSEVVGQTTLPVGMADGWVDLDATAAERAWIEEGLPNYGLLLCPRSGQYTYHYYHSRDSGNPALRPRLVVTYTVGGALTPTPTEAPALDRRVYLPLILSGWPAQVATPTATPTTATPSQLVQPADLVYQGAFRLPGDDTPPQTFAYGGNAMTFNPDGPGDTLPGSLFIMGHDRQAWGALPDGNQVAEISIPVPVLSDDLDDLNYGGFIQDFQDVTAGYFTQLEEIPKVGMQYLKHPATGPKVHLAWGQHLQPQDVASHAWFSPALDEPDLQGIWFVGHQDLYSVNGYMLDIPAAWADANVGGRYLATGRTRDGGQGGMGPALFAYRPWLPGGSPPPSGTHLEEVTLLLYENSRDTEEITRCLSGYQHADEWEGGAWITTPSGKHAVLFAGTKGNGTKYWYGYIHPDGPEQVCVDAHVTDYTTCRLADGSPCPPGDFTGCCDEESDTCVSQRGWWTTRLDAQFIFYDPADLAWVAAGDMASWQPQPYASLDIDEHLYLNPADWDLEMLGWGDQRRYRIGDVAYDRENGLLYVLELYADGAKPVIHVWRVEG